MQQNLTAFLHKIEIFEDLTLRLLEQICDRAKVVEYTSGTRILRRGEVGSSMFVLLSGKVHIPVLDQKENIQYTSELLPGQIFGEMALLTGHPRISDVLAIEDCSCLCLAKEIVEHLMRTNPDIAQMLTAILRERTKRAGAPQKVGKYTILDELARGSMAVVYNGYHPELERPLAIKMLHHELVYQPQFAERFRHEAKIIAHLRHPNIIDVFDLEEAYATFFIIMEKVKGIELQHAIQTHGKLSYTETRRILRQLLHALQFAHEQGVVHRDLKPSNIMIDESHNAKLMDFGIAYVPQSLEAIDEAEMLLGTPHFMAPEQHRCEHIDHRADIYALGIIAFNMLTGSLPFNGNVHEIAAQKQKKKRINIRKIEPNIPQDLEKFIRMTIQQKPSDRAEDCQELLDILKPTEPSGYKLRELSAQTLTLAYPKEQRQVARALLEKYKQQARKVPNIVLHEKRDDT